MTKSDLWLVACVCTVLFTCTSPTSCVYCDNVKMTCFPPLSANTSIVDCQADSSSCFNQDCSDTEVCVAYILAHIHVNVIDASVFDAKFNFFSDCLSKSNCKDVNATPVFATLEVLEVNLRSTKPVTSKCCCNSDIWFDTNFTVPIAFDDYPVTTRPPTASEFTNSTGGRPSSVLISTALLVPLTAIALIVTVILAFIFVSKKNMASRCCVRHVRRRGGQGGAGDLSSPYAPQPWSLQGLLGQGRFGHVYKALYRDQLVAVKVYTQHCRTWWENESHISSLDSTRHKNILEYNSRAVAESRAVAGTSPLQLYLVTQYYPLGSLEAHLRAHVVTWVQACQMVRSVTSGLRHLHAGFYLNERGVRTDKYPIAHRDLKSSNILVKSEDGECVIADLGLALELKPMDDPNEIANYGQVGTLRYMSPEALEARINLYDTESFKQIDMYALGLVMWEVMSRCCVFTVEDLAPYQLPYEDLVPRASLELMKEVVCIQEYRPSIPAIWTDHMPLSQYADMVRECLDRDPESRPTAGNVAYHMANLLSYSLQDLLQHSNSTPMQNHTPNHTPLGRSNSYLSSMHPGFIQENSQSSPPPCYSPTDPIPVPSRMAPKWDRNHILSSMPHIVQTEAGSELDQNLPPHQSSRSLLSSVTTPPFSSTGEGCVMSLGRNHAPSSSHLHSSFHITSELRGNYDPLPDDSSIDSGSSSLAGGHGDEECVPGLEPECRVPNSDSGIQTHSLSLNRLSQGSLYRDTLALEAVTTDHVPHPSFGCHDDASNVAQTSF